MRTINFTEFRNKASTILSAVEKGEIMIVMRHGKPIAKITPAENPIEENNLWKKPALRHVVKRISLSSTILEERSSS